MTFNFDGGDILILILVAIAFILSRRFDKTGRSLEKVRRYAEKSKTELDAIVRERELGLKDLAVDLEVQEKTNREILARTDAAREEILSRAEELETRVEKIEIHERALEDLNDLAIRVDENLVRLKEESAYVDQVGSRLSDVKDKFSSFAEKDADRFASFQQEMLGDFKGELESMSAGLEDSGRQLSLYRETLEGLSARRDEEVNDKLSIFRDDLETIEEDFRERLRKVAEEGARLEDDAFTALNEKIDSRSERLKNNWLGGMNELKDNVATTASEIQDMLNEAKTSMDIAGNEFRETEERLKDDADVMEKTMQELREKLEHLVESKENELLESVEVRQNEYRRTVEDRFERIEGFIKDMDTVAESLRSSQTQTVREIDEAFVAFDSEMTERRELERTRIEEESAALRQDMSDLERGLDELKSRAYDNVSEKLQVFEDEFFSDLKNRDSQMRAALEEWNKNAELELAELGLKAGRDREATERRYSTELKQKLTDLQTRVFGQFEGFQDQVDGFRESLNGRIKASEDELKAFRESLEARLSREREAAAAEFVKAYDGFEKDVTERFSKANKTIGQKLSDFARDIESRDKELTGEYQSSRNDLVEWKQRMAIQIDEALRDSGESIDTMKSDFAAKISELQDEYSARTEQLILESGEDRAALRREIGLLEESVTRLTAELDEKSRDSLEALKEQSEAFLFEFRKNSRDAREEMERKVKELRQSVQEARERAEANRKEMSAHTDAEYTRLMRNLDEIDRRQRDFITETHVFERADEMKSALEADMAELNRQLNEVGKGRDEIRSINTQYEKSLSLYEEVSGKLARFLSEQQKVDNLEGKIARIGSLSESVDLKLVRVTDANDTLQDLQVRLKQLEDLHEDLGARYQRLTEKSGILDAATEGVDKNFERLARIEDILKDLAERILPLREELTSAEERQRQLEEDREKIDLVVGKVSTIDSTIAELDGKLDDLGKAREWLARTETRLEEISNEAQQKVRLLGTLTKRESGGRKSAGSPDMSTRRWW